MSSEANSSPASAQPTVAQADPTPERWQRIKELFAEAQQRSAGERVVFLQGECGADESLRSEVESLLTAAESEGVDLAPARTPTGPLREDPMIGRRIGAYKIIHGAALIGNVLQKCYKVVAVR